MKYRVAIFDMDGTILDTLEDLSVSVNYALGELGFPPRSRAEVRAFLGNGALKLIRRSAPEGLAEERLEELYRTFAAHYKDHCADHTAPYEGILPLLEELKAKGLALAVVSNKDDAAVKILSEQYFPGIFSCSVGRRDGVREKPAPDTVEKVLSHLGLSSSEAVYIGDSDVDVATAENAGMDGIAVTWGFRDEAFLRAHGATVLAGDAGELRALLLEEA